MASATAASTVGSVVSPLLVLMVRITWTAGGVDGAWRMGVRGNPFSCRSATVGSRGIATAAAGRASIATRQTLSARIRSDFLLFLAGFKVASLGGGGMLDRTEKSPPPNREISPDFGDHLPVFAGQPEPDRLHARLPARARVQLAQDPR